MRSEGRSEMIEGWGQRGDVKWLRDGVRGKR